MDIQIISGFLGAGKTTFLNKYLPTLSGVTAVIENEFGDIGLDKELIDEDKPIMEIKSGCICCSLVGDFQNGIKEIIEKYNPDRILIEPSGVARLSDIVKACEILAIDNKDIKIAKLIVIVDISSYEDYIEIFGPFYLDQIRNANIIFLSNIENLNEPTRKRLISRIREENLNGFIFENNWRILNNDELSELVVGLNNYNSLNDIGNPQSIPSNLVFSSVSIRDIARIDENKINEVFNKLKEKENGYILRAKGIVENKDGLKFSVNFTPYKESYEKFNHADFKDINTRFIIIGCNLDKDALMNIFN